MERTQDNVLSCQDPIPLPQKREGLLTSKKDLQDQQMKERSVKATMSSCKSSTSAFLRLGWRFNGLRGKQDGHLMRTPQLRSSVCFIQRRPVKFPDDAYFPSFNGRFASFPSRGCATHCPMTVEVY
eukprot:1193173-Amorphochlora_amoeboformis.AAC.1